jgi:hypothetical protein
MCCSACFAEPKLKRLVRRAKQRGDCDYCGESAIAIAPIDSLVHFFEPLLADYQEVQEGTHFIAALDQEADGQPLDELFAEDNPDVFSERIDDQTRQQFVQDMVDAIDRPDPQGGDYGRSVGELWTRPGNEMWAGADDEYFRSPNYRWQMFRCGLTN